MLYRFSEKNQRSLSNTIFFYLIKKYINKIYTIFYIKSLSFFFRFYIRLRKQYECS